jgi:hypothetical protein
MAAATAIPLESEPVEETPSVEAAPTTKPLIDNAPLSKAVEPTPAVVELTIVE